MQSDNRQTNTLSVIGTKKLGDITQIVTLEQVKLGKYYCTRLEMNCPYEGGTMEYSCGLLPLYQEWDRQQADRVQEM